MSAKAPSLSIPMFEIPNLATLQFLMNLERQGKDQVHEKVKSFMLPESALLGADGRPAGDVALRLNKRVTAYLHELVALPTIEQEWTAAAGSEVAREGMISTTSYKVAYMLYMEFGQLLKQRAPEFIQVMDSVLILGLNAVINGEHPLAIYSKTFTAQAKDEAGITLLDAKIHFQKLLQVLADSVLQFLLMKALIVRDQTSTKITTEGQQTFTHLIAVLGSTRSMQAQGANLIKTELKIREGLETAQEAVSALVNPNAELPEA